MTARSSESCWGSSPRSSAPISAAALGLALGDTDTVTHIQRFGGPLNLNVHFHTLALDGVYFERLVPVGAAHDDDLLAELAAASVQSRIATGPDRGRRVGRLGDHVYVDHVDYRGPRCAAIDGFSRHADVAIHGADRQRLERVCRYLARGPLANTRLFAPAPRRPGRPPPWPRTRRTWSPPVDRGGRAPRGGPPSRSADFV